MPRDISSLFCASLPSPVGEVAQFGWVLVYTSLRSSLNRSPFEVLYGHPPRHFGITPPAASSVPDVETMLIDRSTMLDLVRQHLLWAQQRMKLQADKRHSERSFAVGDLVYLKLQPYVQVSLAPGHIKSFPIATSGHTRYSLGSVQSPTSLISRRRPRSTPCSTSPCWSLLRRPSTRSLLLFSTTTRILGFYDD